MSEAGGGSYVPELRLDVPFSSVAVTIAPLTDVGALDTPSLPLLPGDEGVLSVSSATELRIVRLMFREERLELLEVSPVAPAAPFMRLERRVELGSC